MTKGAQGGTEVLLTYEEVAKRLRVGVRTVRRLVALEMLPAVRPGPGGRALRIDEVDVVAYVETRKRRRATWPSAR